MYITIKENNINFYL